MFRRASSIVLWIGLLTAVPAAGQMGAVSLKDDFAADSRKAYQVEGEAAWNAGMMRLSPGARLTRRVALGSSADMRASVRMPISKEETAVYLRLKGERREAEVGILVQAGKARLINLAGTGQDVPLSYPAKDAPAGEQAWELRLGLHYGVVRGKAWPAGTAEPKEWMTLRDSWDSWETREASISAGSAGSARGVGLTVLRIAGSAPAPPLSAEAQRKLEQVSKLNEQMKAFEKARNYRQAAERALDAARVMAEVHGAEDPQTASWVHHTGYLFQQAGDIAAARSYWEQALAVRRKILGDEHLVTANSLLFVGYGLRETGNRTAARPYYEQVLAIRERVLGSEDLNTAYAQHELAWLYQNLGEPARAEKLYREAFDLRRRKLGRKHQGTVQSLTNLVDVLEQLAGAHAGREDFASAARVWVDVSILKADLYGIGHWKVTEAQVAMTGALRLQTLPAARLRELAEARQLDAQADPLYAQGRYQEAIALREKSLEIRRRVLGEEHSDYLGQLNWLALLYSQLGHQARAELLSQQALRLSRKLFGDRHPKVAFIYHNLGTLSENLGDSVVAVGYFRESAAIRGQTLGEKDRDTAASLTALAGSLEKLAATHQHREDFTAAQKVREEVAGLRQKLFGDRTRWEVAEALWAVSHTAALAKLDSASRRRLDEADRLAQQAETLRREGKHKNALEPAQRALAIVNEVLGEASRSFGDRAFALAQLHFDLKDYAAAEPLFRQALLVRGQALGAEHPDVALTHNQLGVVHYRRGDDRQAALQYRQAALLFDKAHGLQHRETVNSFTNLAAALERVGRQYLQEENFTAARAALEEVRTVRAKLHGEKSWQAIDAQVEFAYIARLIELPAEQSRKLIEADRLLRRAEELNAPKSRVEALRPAREALDIRRQILGPDHPYTAAALDWVGGLLDLTGDLAGARPYYQQTLEIRRKALGLEHPRTADSLQALGMLVAALDDHAAGRALLEQTVAARVRILGADDKATVATRGILDLLRETVLNPSRDRFLSGGQTQRLKEARELLERSKTLYGTGKKSEAETLAAEADAAARTIVGEQDEITALVLAALFRIHQKREDFEAARKIAREVLALRTKLHGAKDWRVADARLDLDYSERLAALDGKGRAEIQEAADLWGKSQELKGRGRDREALVPARQNLERLRQLLGEESVLTAGALDWLGFLHRSLGEDAEARGCHEKALAIVVRQLGPEHPSTAMTLNDLALSCQGLGARDAARKHHERALAIRKATLGAEARDTLTSLGNLGVLLLEMDDLAAARSHLEQALSLSKKTQGSEHRGTASALENLARLHIRLQDHATARAYYEQALSVREKADGVEASATGSTLVALGSLAEHLGDYATAQAHFKRCLAISLKARGPEHLDSGVALNRLGLLFTRMGHYEVARPWLEQAVVIFKNGHGPRHPATAVVQNNLAVLHEKVAARHEEQGDFARARKARQEVLAVMHDVHGGENHWQITSTRLALANVDRLAALPPDQRRRLAEVPALNQKATELRHQGRQREAVPLMEQALRINQDILGSEHRDTVLSLRELGATCCLARQLDRAEVVAQQAVEGSKKVLGVEHPDHATSLFVQGLVYSFKQDHVRAEALYRQTLTLRKKLLGEKDRDYVDTLTSLAGVHEMLARKYEAQEDYASARKARQEVLDLGTQVYGKDNWQTVTARINLADAERLAALNQEQRGRLKEANRLVQQSESLREKGKAADAVTAAKQALGIREQVLGAEHVTTASTLRHLGSLLQEKKEDAAARACLEQALAIHKKVLGPDHPDTANVLVALGLLLNELDEQAAAQSHLEQAVAILKRTRGDSGELATALHNLGYVLDRRGNSTAARPYYEQALALRNRFLGPDHPRSANSLHSLGRVFRDMGDFPTARSYLEQALTVRRKVLHEDDPETFATLNDLALVVQALGDVAAARSHMEQALALGKKVRGPNHPNLILLLRNLGDLQAETGDFTAARAHLDQALALSKKVRGDEHRDTAQCLEALARLSRAAGAYSVARTFYEKALAIYRKTSGAYRADVVNVLNALGTVLEDMGDEKAAYSCFEQGLAIVEKEWGAEHHFTANQLITVGNRLRDRGDHAAARQHLERALAVSEKVWGREHPQTATVLGYLSMQLYHAGDYPAARRHRERALAIDEKVSGLDHDRTAISLSYLAFLIDAMGDAAAARVLYERALAIRQKVWGPDHPRIVSDLNNLALVLKALGDHQGARKCFEQELGIFKKVLDGQQPPNPATLYRVGDQLKKMGDLTAARSYYEHALAAREKTLGPEHPFIAGGLGKLGGLLFEQGDAAAARTHIERAVAIYRKTRGPEHLDTANSLIQLGNVLVALKDAEAAQRCHEQALAIYEKVRGPEHLHTAGQLHDLGTLLRDRKDYRTARPHLDKALAIRRKVLGEDHPSTADSRIALGELLAADNPRFAWEPLLRGTATYARRVGLALTTNPESEHAGIVGRRRLLLEGCLSLAESAPTIPATPVDRGMELLAAVLDWKAMSGQALLARQEALSLGSIEETGKLYQELKAVRHQLARVQLQAPVQVAAQHRDLLDKLRQQHDALERQLGERVKDYATLRKSLSAGPQELAALLPSGAVLVELVRYRRFDFQTSKDGWGAARYGALLLWRAANTSAPPVVRFVFLGEAKPIEEAVRAWRFGAEAGNVEPAAERTLRERVWAPLAKALPPQTNRLLIAPDGELTLLPFEAIRLADERYLVEAYTVSYLSNGRDLTRRLVAKKDLGPAVVLTDPDYEAAGDSALLTHTGPRRSAELSTRGLRFKRLPGFAQEADAVARAWQKARPKEPLTVLQGHEASEERLAVLRRPQLLYAITHGFFLPDLQRLQSREGRRDFEIVPLQPAEPPPTARLAVYEDPRLRSGLALAGANQWSRRVEQGRSDGLLTAYEVEQLDLWGTELVVLSACETGLGQVSQIGEGVLGLRRAFQGAGAQTMLVSLWKVPDSETELLMTRFFELWLVSKKGKADALRTAQLELIQRFRRSDDPQRRSAPPLYWAGFICHGQPE